MKAWKVGLLCALYFAQGLPFGFQANALPLYLTELGLTMTEVSLARMLRAGPSACTVKRPFAMLAAGLLLGAFPAARRR